MPSRLSPDLRRRFSELMASRLSARSAARRLLISPASGVRLAAKIREGVSLETEKCGRPVGSGKLGPHRDFLIELLEQDPDITLAELRGALIEVEGVTVGVPAIFRMLKRLGFVYNKRRWSQMSDARFASAAPVTITILNRLANRQAFCSPPFFCATFNRVDAITNFPPSRFGATSGFGNRYVRPAPQSHFTTLAVDHNSQNPFTSFSTRLEQPQALAIGILTFRRRFGF